MKRSLFVGTLLVATLGVIFAGIGAAQEGSGSAAKEGAEYLQAMKEKAAAIKSVKAKQMMTMPMMGQEMQMGGGISYAAPNLFRMELGMEGVPAGSTIIISDGETVWTHMPATGMTQKIDIKRVKETLGEDHPFAGGMGPNQQGANFGDPFGGFLEDSVQYVASEPVGDIDCYVFEAEIDSPAQMKQTMGKMMPRKVKVWLGKDDGMLRKQVMFTPQGTRMMEMTFTDVEINPELDKSLFTYTPKPDENVMDMTEMVLRMSEPMGGKAPKGESMPEGSGAKPDEGSGAKDEGSESKSEGSGEGSETLDRGI